MPAKEGNKPLSLSLLWSRLPFPCGLPLLVIEGSLVYEILELRHNVRTSAAEVVLRYCFLDGHGFILRSAESMTGYFELDSRPL